MPERELNESGEKGTVTGIIFSKRKGGIKGTKGARGGHRRPYKD